MRADIPFPDELSEKERIYQGELAHWQKEETGYHAIQGTKPQTLAYALTDSPAGLAGWIVEKFQTWSDHRGDFEGWIDRDSLLTNIMLYWVTGAINSSFWPYYAIRHDPWPLPEARIETPTGYAEFPVETRHPPRSFAEGAFNIQRWTRDAARRPLRRARGARPAGRGRGRVLPPAAAGLTGLRGRLRTRP